MIPASEPHDFSSSPWLIVGLGNPGPEYADTYHNVGFRVVSSMADTLGVRIKDRCGQALISRKVIIGGRNAVLVLPQTFMNRTGAILAGLFERFEVNSSVLVVVYDDLALPVGRLRIRQKGSAAGHNGIKSIISSCGSDEFLRVRVGIQPESAPGQSLAPMRDFVLSRVARRDREYLESAEVLAGRAVETLLAEGAERAMAAFNGVDLREAKKEE